MEGANGFSFGYNSHHNDDLFVGNFSRSDEPLMKSGECFRPCVFCARLKKPWNFIQPPEFKFPTNEEQQQAGKPFTCVLPPCFRNGWAEKVVGRKSTGRRNYSPSLVGTAHECGHVSPEMSTNKGSPQTSSVGNKNKGKNEIGAHIEDGGTHHKFRRDLGLTDLTPVDQLAFCARNIVSSSDTTVEIPTSIAKMIENSISAWKRYTSIFQTQSNGVAAIETIDPQTFLLRQHPWERNGDTEAMLSYSRRFFFSCSEVEIDDQIALHRATIGWRTPIPTPHVRY